MTKRVYLLLLPALTLALGACDDDGGDGGDGDGASDGGDGDGDGDGAACDDGTGPSYAATVKPIIDATCIEGCHEPGGIWSVADYSGDSYAALVGVRALQVSDLKFVEPCDSDASYMWHKVAGTHADVGGAGTKQMPLDTTTCDSANYLSEDCTAAPLGAADLTAIDDWIKGGARP